MNSNLLHGIIPFVASLIVFKLITKSNSVPDAAPFDWQLSLAWLALVIFCAGFFPAASSQNAIAYLAFSTMLFGLPFLMSSPFELFHQRPSFFGGVFTLLFCLYGVIVLHTYQVVLPMEFKVILILQAIGPLIKLFLDGMLKARFSLLMKIALLAFLLTLPSWQLSTVIAVLICSFIPLLWLGLLRPKGAYLLAIKTLPLRLKLPAYVYLTCLAMWTGTSFAANFSYQGIVLSAMTGATAFLIVDMWSFTSKTEVAA